MCTMGCLTPVAMQCSGRTKTPKLQLLLAHNPDGSVHLATTWHDDMKRLDCQTFASKNQLMCTMDRLAPVAMQCSSRTKTPKLHLLLAHNRDGSAHLATTWHDDMKRLDCKTFASKNQ